MLPRLTPRALALLAFAVGACTSSSAPTALSDSAHAAPAVASLSPAANATAVSTSTSVTLNFTGSMMTGMEMLVVVHEGSVTGPQVMGTASWSSDRKTMTFTPSAPLKSRTTYVVHLSPSLQGANGMMINLTSGTMMGGQMVSAGMMGSAATGMMGGQSVSGMMGSGWKAADGTYGMMFTFTTA